MLVSASGLAIAACVTDWNQRQIPHWLLGGVVLLWGVAAWLAPDALGAPPLSSLLCGVGAMAIGFALYTWAGLGGGDAKLLAALAIWLGPWDIGLWLLGAAAVGLLLVLVAVAGRSTDFLNRGLPFAWAISPPAVALLLGRAATLAAS
ncbi:MAG: prepilin peptidase [Gammaproteobacteria bacterium]|nr:prepilin peptidase [Gammaproteobacteria bacterium]